MPRKVLKSCSSYLDMAAVDKQRVVYSYQPGRQRGDGLDAVMTTEALLSRQLLGWPRDFPPLIKGVGMISAHLQAVERPEHLLLVLRDSALAQHGGRQVATVESQDPRRLD